MTRKCSRRLLGRLLGSLGDSNERPLRCLVTDTAPTRNKACWKAPIFRGCSSCGTTSPSCPVYRAFKALYGLFPANLSGFADLKYSCCERAGTSVVQTHLVFFFCLFGFFFHGLCLWHSPASLPCPASQADWPTWQLPLLDPWPLSCCCQRLLEGRCGVGEPSLFPREQVRRGVKTHRRDLKGSSHVSEPSQSWKAGSLVGR